MILALSGTEDIEPKFPTLFSNWGPIMTMETITEKKRDDFP
jgi:hypothetical protein